jgi:uncharacterized protein (DUF58 family)
MRRLNAGTIGRAYLVIVLLLAVTVSPPFQLGLSLALLALQLYCAYRPPKASLNLILVVVSLVLAPLTVEALVGAAFAVLLIVPALLLLDSSLKEYTSTQTFTFSRVGRSASSMLKSLGVCLGLVFLFSLAVSNLTLMLAASVLLIYLAICVVYVCQRLPKTALEESKTWSRIVVGDTDSKLVSLKTKARMPVQVFLEPADLWANVEPARFALAGQADATLRFTPPLAGPSKVVLQASVIDSHGLIVTGQMLQPVDLHIIPRAKYAEWLANKFLEQTSQGAGSAPGVPRSLSRAGRSGVEFHGTHLYQPGDSWKNLDWKHSCMLGELIVKEFSEPKGHVGIIVADLTAKDAEEADRLAYNLVMSALTLASEALPAALAVYNQKEVLAVTQPRSPRETLKKALELTEKITVVEPKEKVLQPLEMRRLKRSISQLAQAKTETAQKLKEVLELESEANLQAAKQHPAYQALMKAAKLTQAPAVITVASPVGYDSDALLLTLEQLREKGYGAVTVA